MTDTLVAGCPTSSPEPLFHPLDRCWVCGGGALRPSHAEWIDIGGGANDPDAFPVLGPYDGQAFVLNRCRDCGFRQPAVLPAEPRYFDVLYDQKWGAAWMREEFESGYKDGIFRTVLRELGRRVAVPQRSLLDVGTHVGRMLHLARQAGWRAEGIELNPRTAAYAAERTGLPVHRVDASRLADTGARFGAVALTDVLEHIPNPVSLLTTLRRLVVPGGWVAVKVPHGPNQRLKQQVRALFDATTNTGIATSMVHINHFTPHSLRRALVRAGFDRVTLTTGAPDLAAGGGFKLRWSRATRRLVYHAARMLPGGVHTPLAMNLQAYARNPFPRTAAREAP